MRALLIIKDTTLSRSLMEVFPKKNHHCQWVRQDVLFEKDVYNYPSDIWVVDWDLDNSYGKRLLEAWRKLLQKPAVLVLTANDKQQDKNHLLRDMQAEYLAAPFNALSILEHVQALELRLKQKHQTETLHYGNYAFEPDSNCVYYKDEIIFLTPLESRLLARLLRSNGQMVSTTQLSQVMYGSTASNNNSVTVYVCRLREKLKELEIKTIYGGGYTVAPCKPIPGS
jgi:DNA-binding response OmpR family regulator